MVFFIFSWPQAERLCVSPQSSSVCINDPSCCLRARSSLALGLAPASLVLRAYPNMLHLFGRITLGSRNAIIPY